MAITPSFTVSQNYSTPNILSLVDNSTGTDNTLTQRRVYLIKDDGTYLVPQGTTTNYIVWSYAVSFIDIDVLNKDYALNIRVEWLAGNVVEETKEDVYLFKLYGELFLYGLSQRQESNPQIINSFPFYINKMRLRTELDSAVGAVVYGSDILTAQSCLDRAKYLMDNENFNF
jgi:hypothetical protein